MIRQEWLQAIAPEAPCGPNLDNEQDYVALEQAARGKEERQYGKFVSPAEPPDWADVVKRASSLLDRSRDLRIVFHLTRGLASTQGLVGLRDALTFVEKLLESFWEPLHPQLVIDGEADPLIRSFALGSFADADGEGLVRDLRAAVFLRVALGTFTVRDVEKILDSKTLPADRPATPDQLNAMVRDVIVGDHEALSEATQALQALDRISAFILTRLDATLAPDFTRLRNLLQSLDGITRPIRDEVLKSSGTATSKEERIEVAAAAAAPVVSSTGEIRTRDEAVRALERVCDYFGRNEPTSPAPLLIRRAQRLMTMPFMDIIKDLAPDAMSQVEKITGAKQS